MKLPCVAWVLTPNYKPVVVLMVDQLQTERIGHWYVTDSGRLHRADHIYQTQEEARAAAIACLDKEQAAAQRMLILIHKRRMALNHLPI